jgi:ferredoxin
MWHFSEGSDGKYKKPQSRQLASGSGFEPATFRIQLKTKFDVFDRDVQSLRIEQDDSKLQTEEAVETCPVTRLK